MIFTFILHGLKCEKCAHPSQKPKGVIVLSSRIKLIRHTKLNSTEIN